MDGDRFDRLTRVLARIVTRRGAVKSLAGGVLGGAALVGLPPLAGAAEGERGVLLYELMAEAVKREPGDCAKVAKAADDFRTRYAPMLEEVATEERSWTREQRVAHRERYGARVSRATASLYGAAIRCGYAPNSASPICLTGAADPARGTPVADVGIERLAFTPIRAGKAERVAADGCQGCDCGCICATPPTTSECWLDFVGCMGGSKGSCCWWGICLDHDTPSQCEIQCPNCCNY